MSDPQEDHVIVDVLNVFNLPSEGLSQYNATKISGNTKTAQNRGALPASLTNVR